MPDKINRRGFLKLGAAGAAAAALTGCQRPRRWVVLEPFVRPPEEQVSGLATWYASTCRQCPAGCGIMVRVMNGRAVKLEGNPEHPLNRGKLCARGQAGLQVLYNPDRLDGPVKQARRGSREFDPISWEEGLNTLAAGLQSAGGGLATWAGSTSSGHVVDLFHRWAQALGGPEPIVHDLYTAINGYPMLAQAGVGLGAPAGLPTYELNQADLIVSFGADFLSTWLSATALGKGFGAFREAGFGKPRGVLVQFEPRMSLTGANADRWLPLRPGSEAIVAQALMKLVANLGEGPAERVKLARAWATDIDPTQAAADSDLALADLTEIARLIANAKHPIALPGSTLVGREGAVEAIQAVQALNIMTGTGLSVGDEAQQVLRNDVSPLTDVLDLIDRMNAGEIKVLLVDGANPLYDLPEQLGLQTALQKVPLVVSFSPIVDETATWSDVILPDHTYLEGWGYDLVSPSAERTVIGSQQPVVTPLKDTRATADVLLTIAKAIPAATQAMPWSDEVSMLKDIVGGLPPGDHGSVDPEVAWASFLQHGGWWSAGPDLQPAPAAQAQPISVPAASFQGASDQFPFHLHLYLPELLSDGRGANQPWLQGSPAAMTTVAWQTWVEVNPKTAAALGLQDGDVVKVRSENGEIEAPVYVYRAIRPDTVAIPLGQGHVDYGRYAKERGANAVALVGGRTDSRRQNLTWNEIRVQLTPTGKHVALARMENPTGVAEGFINQSQPGG
jgi:anaerobic selenocysteine-containing dehydrogenase